MIKPTHAQMVWSYLYKRQSWYFRLIILVAMIQISQMCLQGWFLIFKK
jgi:hypothetical protein